MCVCVMCFCVNVKGRDEEIWVEEGHIYAPSKIPAPQETPRVTGKFGLGIRNEAGQMLIEFCQENVLVIANTIFQ